MQGEVVDASSNVGDNRVGVGPDAMRRVVEFGAPNWRKLGAVVGLLEAKLVDIVRRWNNGELEGSGLSSEEVRQLVVALFEDTEYRQQQLAFID